MAEVYAGLDVSDKMTHVCVADGSGRLCGLEPAPRTLR